MEPSSRAELATLADDLRRIFRDRLISLLAYGRATQRPSSSLAIVSAMTHEDLEQCAGRAAGWRRAGAAAPLLLTEDEFMHSTDAFPIEYAEMHDTALVLHGSNPFATPWQMRREDLRRACEVQVRSHLLHLREDYLECGGRPRDVAALVVESAPGFAVLLRHLARLQGASPTTNAELAAITATQAHMDVRVFDDVLALADPQQKATVDAARVFPEYLSAVTRLTKVVDAWREHPETSTLASEQPKTADARSERAGPL